MATNKTKITITWIADHGKSHELYCNKILMLRKARRAGDTEIVNHYVLGRLNQNAGNDILFTTEEL